MYLLTDPFGKSYVGKTVQGLSGRLSAHKSKKSACRAIRDALHLHGDAMKVTVLIRCSEDALDINESMYIEALDTVHPRGYNLRCGTMAARPVMAHAVSTFVHTPVGYDDVNDERDVERSIKEDIEAIVDNSTLKPWAGVVHKSVSDVNKIRGAKQDLPWAGPVKGIPVDKDYGKQQEASTKQPNMFNFEYPFAPWSSMLTKAEIDKSLEKVRLFKASKMAQDDIYENQLRNQKKREMLQMRNQMMLDIEKLKMKAAACEELGLHDEANAAKRKLAEI